MLTNVEYLQKFVKKHHYKDKIHVQCIGEITTENINTVIFDTCDIPSGVKIELDDIKYDIDSLLPEDVFYRWLEYIGSNKYVSYKYWMTKMDNKYFPIGVDNSEALRIKDSIYSKLNELKAKTWI